MSFNDMVSTGIGGIARGEMSYRVSSLILDNTRRGKGRWGREAAALLFDPIRGFNRLVTGDASEVKGNPPTAGTTDRTSSSLSAPAPASWARASRSRRTRTPTATWSGF